MENFLDITFDKTFKVTNYIIKNKGKINKAALKFEENFKNRFLEKDISELHLKDTIFEARFSFDKKDYINASGLYTLNEKDYQEYDFKNKFLKKIQKLI